MPLAGRIDVKAETERLKGQLKKATGELDGIERKLMNQDFVEKAPEAVVEKERARRTELSARMAKLKEGLAILRDMGTDGGDGD